MRIHNSSPPVITEQQVSSPFSQSSIVGKVVRVVTALLFILLSLGLILLAYKFSDLLNYRFCVSTHSEQSDEFLIPKPSPKKLSVSELLSKGVIEDYLKSHVLPQLEILDSTYIFQFTCALHDQYPTLLPCDCLIPLTIFNYQEEICAVLKNKQQDETSQICLFNDTHPITCPPTNYHRLLKQARVLPFMLWYDPESTNYQQTIEKMQELSSQNSVGNSHWTLIILDLDAQRITYFDSQKTYIAPINSMTRQMEDLAYRLAKMGFVKTNKTPFDVHIAVSEQPLQSEMGLCCGLWCCQYLKWYMEDVNTEILQEIPDSPEYKTLLLHSFFNSFKDSMQKYADLSWPIS